MDATALLKQGVRAIQQKNVPDGRTLIKQSIKEDPYNDVAWVWLARTEPDPRRRQQCLQRALKINPANVQAHKMLAQIRVATQEMPVIKGDTGALFDVKKVAPTPIDTQELLAVNTLPPPPSNTRRIAPLLREAQQLVKDKNYEGAIEKWVEVLALEVDHEEALQEATAMLDKMGFREDARELLQRAVDADSRKPFVYTQAIDYAMKDQDFRVVDDLRERLVRLPEADDEAIAKIVLAYRYEMRTELAYETAQNALKERPKSQPLLIVMGDLLRRDDKILEAMSYYNRAGQLGKNKEAEARLAKFPPILSDRERSSVWMAWREVAGIVIFILFLAWQDARLNFMGMGAMRWLGVVLSLIGGYLLITATSSPQQKPLAGALGGHIPPLKNDAVLVQRPGVAALQEATRIPLLGAPVRLLFGVIGLGLLGAAVWLTFGSTIQLLLDLLGVSV